MRTDKLAATWDGFLRLSRGERREFLTMLRDWHLQRRIEAVAARGGNYPYRGPVSFADLTLDGADLEPSLIGEQGAGAGLSGDPGAAGHADQATQSTRRKSVSLVNSHAAHVPRRRSGLLVKSCQTFAISGQCADRRHLRHNADASSLFQKPNAAQRSMIALAAPAFPWPGYQNPQQGYLAEHPHPSLVIARQ
jgi:hypothetical protein